MDPISLLVGALAAGAQAALKDTASTAIKDAYNGLKNLIVRKFGSSKPSVEGLEQKPESKAKQASVQEDLQAAGAAGDDEVLERAHELVQALRRDDPGGAAALGVDLERIEAAFLQIGSVRSSGGGVRVRDSRFSGGVSIGNVDAGTGPAAPNPPDPAPRGP